MTIYSRTYGVEIEAMFPATVTRAAVSQALNSAGVRCADVGYSHATVNYWKVVTDGSLSGGNGMELVSPPMTGEDGHEQIRKVGTMLEALGATVNKTCGLHVHVAARELSSAALRKLAVIYMESEAVIDSLMPPSRRGNQNMYCQSLVGLDMNRLATASSAADIANAINRGGRYVKLNFTSFWRHGTVEFRHHSGTVDADKINNWVLACLRMVATAAAEAGQPINTGTATQARPSNARMAIIYDMMNNPNGVSRAEVASRLGRTSMPPMNRILVEAGIAYEERRAGREARYVLRQTVGAPQSAVAVTLDTFAARLGMQANEIAFWQERHAALASVRITASDRVQRATRR